METALFEICMKHGLIGLGVNVFGAPAKPYIGVYVHWAEGECAGGTGKTFDAALERALAGMTARRAVEPA